MHGISTIIVMILLVLITVSLVGMSYMFFSGTFTQTTEATQKTVSNTVSGMLSQMSVVSMAGNSIILKNTGSTDLSNFTIFINNAPVNFTVTPEVIKEGQLGTVTIYDFIKEGDDIGINTVQGALINNKASDPCEQAVLCLKLDEGEGTIIHDSSGNGNNGRTGNNVLPNPGFESGLWISGYPWSLDSGHEGSNSAKMSSSTSYCNDYQYVDLPVLQNKNYFIGSWIKTNEITVAWFSTVGIATPPSWAGFTLAQKQLTGINDWTWVNLSNYNSGTNANLRFFVTEQHCNPPPSGAAWFDDVYAGYDIPLWDIGRYNKALSFDGIDDYAIIPNSNSLSVGGTEITMEAWIYPRNPTAGYTMFIRKQTPGYGFWIMPDGKLYAEVYHPNYVVNGYSYSETGSYTLSPNAWYHVVAVFKQNAYFKIYVNGVDRTVGSNVKDFPVGVSTNDLWLGYPGWMGGSGDAFFNGLIDEVRIYSRAIY